MNVLIAGGAGFIGCHLTDALIDAGCKVVCADILRFGGREKLEKYLGSADFSFYETDICDERRLDEIFAAHSFDRVYHLAANSDIQKGGGDPSIDFHDTFLTTVSLLNAMRRHGAREMLFASTSAVYGDKRELLKEDTGDLRPISYYGAAKLASESFISAYSAMNGLRACVTRFPNVVGPGLTHGAVYDFIAKLRKDPAKLEILGDGKQEKPYIYVSDLVDAMLSMNYPEGVTVCNAGVETATTVRRIADIVCEEMGLDNVEYRFTGGAAGWPGDVPKFQYDLSKIHALGWRAKHTSDEAVRLAARLSL
ncbi:MAG: NAD-dependent epimerase/dehydratase family protein [Synergistaceae bacterium]|jgi:UDP-glucose 4-epimerase|nr:NAD-dependent epimerase/dehydratase family protein [Synergistaceae bacterium]MDR1515510.1 NAD-dependent epimerase/dehydratase family protein [Synergistaceae bacterium]